MGRQIGQFSGGQQQRLFIARALVQNADIYLLDEPFAGVDLSDGKNDHGAAAKTKRAGKTILIVHHDLPSVEEYFDWALLLEQPAAWLRAGESGIHAGKSGSGLWKGQMLFR